MIKVVHFWPRLAAEAALFPANVALISIGDPQQAAPVLKGGKEVLRLEFYDLKKPEPSDPRFGLDSMFTAAQAARVQALVARLHAEPTEYEIVVHCEAGVSRSAAVALYVEAASGCAFPGKGAAGGANEHIVAVLCKVGKVSINIPPLKKSAGGILLFS